MKLDQRPNAKAISVAAFTGGRRVPSRRFRLEQYLPHLAPLGVHVTEFTARLGSWPPRSKALRPFWLPATIADRVPSVLRSHLYDVTLLQREMVSTLRTLEGLTHRPRVLDVDDAVWLNRGAEKTFRSLVEMCDGVICGNNFIASEVRRWKNELIILPTAVDTDRYCPPATAAERPIIGWSGLGSGIKYLLGLEGALAQVLARRKDAMLRVVSDVDPAFRQIDRSRVDFIRWSPENEVRAIQEISVGLMPLDDTPWSRGKCSYKMLLYMACGVPVAVSPFGMNEEVLALGNIGVGPRTEAEWVEALLWMLDHPDKASEMGRSGRRVAIERFSLKVLGPALAAYLKGFCP